jgi:small subunit ribosomal protein S1
MDATTSFGGEPDFTTLLEEAFAFDQPERGDILKGVVLAIDNYGIIVDVGLKRDGVVSRHDLDKLGPDVSFDIGEEVPVMVVLPEDREGNLVVSVAQARQSKDWTQAEQLLESGDIWEGTVTDANRGGPERGRTQSAPDGHDRQIHCRQGHRGQSAATPSGPFAA